MSFVLGIDFSTNHIDCVMLDESTNQATWHRWSPVGESALDRLLQVPLVLPLSDFYEDVYLVAVEIPYGRGQPGTQSKLNRVFGAIVATLPRLIPVWAVTPAEWRKELGLPGNASKECCAESVRRIWSGYGPTDISRHVPQDALDAYAVAYYARQVNARALAPAGTGSTE